jgi:hypothetical protein
VTLSIRSILSNLLDPCSASVVFFRQKKKDVTKFAFSLGTRYGEPVHPRFFSDEIILDIHVCLVTRIVSSISRIWYM